MEIISLINLFHSAQHLNGLVNPNLISITRVTLKPFVYQDLNVELLNKKKLAKYNLAFMIFLGSSMGVGNDSGAGTVLVLSFSLKLGPRLVGLTRSDAPALFLLLFCSAVLAEFPDFFSEFPFPPLTKDPDGAEPTSLLED
jgi:hypothetical protein